MWLFTSSQTFLLLRKPHIHAHTNRQRRCRQIDVSNYFSLGWFQLSAVSEWIDHKWGMPRKHTQLSLKCNGISRMFEMCPLILPSGLILTALNPLLTIKYALNIREAAPVQRHNLSDAVWLSIWHFHRLVRSELHAELNLNIHINMVPNSFCGCVLFPKPYACEKPLLRDSQMGKWGFVFIFIFCA